MRIVEVIGNVTLAKMHPTLQGATWLLGVPLQQEDLADRTKGRGEPYVIYDELGARADSLIAVSEGAEASAPFYPDQKPIDAYDVAILDELDVETKLVQSPRSKVQSP